MRKFFSIQQLSLNEAETNGNKFIIEYNTILHDPTLSEDVFYSFFDFLANSDIDFDELRINAADSSSMLNAIQYCARAGMKLIADESYRVYLSKLNEFYSVPGRYLASLQKNKRKQIRRTIKYYKQFVNPEIRHAS